MAQSYQAMSCGSPARKLFAPMFRARWQNMQNIVNNSTFLSFIPDGYKTYYTAFIRQWLDWAQGYVPQLHRYDFFSTGMGYTVCDIYAKECMSGGYRFTSPSPALKEFIERWDSDMLAEVFNKMYFFQNAGGNAILAVTPVNGELYPSVYPIDRVVFQTGRRGKITRVLIFNRFVAGETTYYTREYRMVMGDKNYYKVDIAPGTLVTAPTWGSDSLPDVPLKVLSQWQDCYGNIEPSKWYAMPKRLRSLGVYNVRNKSVAVALKDLPGYSDSTLHTALDVLYSIDYNFTQSQVDQYMGKSRALVPKQMQRVTIDRPGTISDGMTFQEAVDWVPPPLDDDFFTQVPDNNLNGDLMKPIFIQPDLRGEQHKYIRDAELELLASKVGLSSSTLANHLVYNHDKTATQVDSEDSTTEKSVNNKRRLASVAINDMLADVAYFYGFTDEIKVDWGRAVSNSARENQELLADFNAGTLPLKDYLRKRWPDLAESEIERMQTDLETERAKNEQIDGESELMRWLNDNSESSPQYTGNSLGRGGNEDQTGGEE